MRHEAHIGLVDAHAERDRGDHHDAVLAQEPGLIRRAHGGVEPGVIRQRVDALGAQELGGLLDALAAQRVDDSRGPRRLRADEREQLLARFDLRVDAVLDVGPVEARDEVLRVGQLQALGDLPVSRVGCRGGQGDARNPRELLAEVAEREVVGAEVVAPLRHAVRFVDRDHAQRAALQQRARR